MFAANRATLPAWRPTGGRGVCRISARSTLTRALPSSESERGNRRRLASERAAAGEMFRRAPRAAYVRVSTDIAVLPKRTWRKSAYDGRAITTGWAALVNRLLTGERRSAI